VTPGRFCPRGRRLLLSTPKTCPVIRRRKCLPDKNKGRRTFPFPVWRINIRKPCFGAPLGEPGIVSVSLEPSWTACKSRAHTIGCTPSRMEWRSQCDNEVIRPLMNTPHREVCVTKQFSRISEIFRSRRFYREPFVARPKFFCYSREEKLAC